MVLGHDHSGSIMYPVWIFFYSIAYEMFQEPLGYRVLKNTKDQAWWIQRILSLLQKEVVEPEVEGAKKILFDYVLKNKYLWLLAISYFFVHVIRMGFGDWGPTYLVQAKGYSLLSANLVVTWFELGGLVGMLIAGWASDYFFKGRRVPIMVLCSIALIVSIVAFWHTPDNRPVLDGVLMAVIGFFIFGPQMLTGIAAAEFTDTKAAGTATGFVGLVAYLGAAASGYPLGLLAEQGGLALLFLLPWWFLPLLFVCF